MEHIITYLRMCYTTERGKRTLWFEYIPMDEIVTADVQFTKNRLLKEDRDEPYM